MLGALNSFFIMIAKNVNNGDELERKTAIIEIKSIHKEFNTYYNSSEIQEKNKGKSYCYIDQSFEDTFYNVVQSPNNKINIDKLMCFISNLEGNFHRNFYEYWLCCGKSIYTTNEFIPDNFSVFSDNTITGLNPP